MLERIRAAGVVAVVRADDPQRAVEAASAAVRGGVRAIEITFTTPGVPEILHDLAERHGEDVLIGAGTVLSSEQARAAAAAGAGFLVSPGFDEDVTAAMHATGALVIVGALTPAEVMRADRAGAAVVKVFPASLGGPGYLRTLRAPFPRLRFMPTGGVTSDNLAAWMAAGAFAVGVGGELCSPAAVASGDVATIEANARELAVALAAARPTDDPDEPGR